MYNYKICLVLYNAPCSSVESVISIKFEGYTFFKVMDILKIRN